MRFYEPIRWDDTIDAIDVPMQPIELPEEDELIPREVLDRVPTEAIDTIEATDAIDHIDSEDAAFFRAFVEVELVDARADYGGDR